LSVTSGRTDSLATGSSPFRSHPALPNAWAPPLQQLVRFWHTPVGQALIERVFRPGRTGHTKPCLLFVTHKGVTVDGAPAAVMKEDDASVLYCLDAAALIAQLNIDATEGAMRLVFEEPGPSGRVPPRRRAPAKQRRARTKVPAPMRDALSREAVSLRAKKKSKKNRRGER